MRAKSTKQTLRDNQAAMNFYAISAGKEPEPLPDVPAVGTRKRQGKTPEGQVLGAVLAYLNVHPQVAWAHRMNSGAFQLEGGRFYRSGWVGASDVIGQMKDGRFIAIECKALRGRVTEAQQLFLDRVRKYGGVAGVVRSVEECELLIKYAVMRGGE